MSPATPSPLDPSPLDPSPLYIVGAGPGDPDLLTRKAWQILVQADAIFYTDSLIPPSFVAAIDTPACWIPTAGQNLEDWLPEMIDRLQAGQRVIRLHDGDPSLYSAIYEPIQQLQAAGIRIEIIPGISAFQLAAARLQTELTRPGLVQTLILTRQGQRTQVPAAEELSLLATHRARLCLYLSAKQIRSAQASLLQHYPPDTPSAICHQLGWPTEQIWRIPLRDLADTSEQAGLVRSTLYLISPALAPLDSLGSLAPLAPNLGSPPDRSQLYNPAHHRWLKP